MADEIKFYADRHIAGSAIRQLRSKGVDILYCHDIGLGDASDEEHLKYATENQRIVVTCDDDFQRLDALWKQQGKAHAGVVYLSMAQGQCQNVGLIVKELSFLYEAANYETDLYNQVWRVKG